ncbi:MAG: SGNH/GDSL hydrolase family protein [Kiritimatiellae bacterium]|nr:SGNH/GDSL hydrolase family protein [Kiritimatiellia bacterium]
MKHNRTIILGIVFAISFLQFAVFAIDKTEEPQKKASTNLPNVFIIGDSISLGYMGSVKKLLKDKANVSRPPRNCQYSGVGVNGVKTWLGDTKWDVIHFNFGIWDSHYLHNGRLVKNPADYVGKELTLRYTTDQYIENLKKILAVLKTTDATLIWASTTSITKASWKDRQTAHADKNKAAAELMKKEGVIINDLYTLALPHLKEWQSTDGVHFKKQGSNQLGKQVASSISDALIIKKRQP